jgi:hypothetical protein
LLSLFLVYVLSIGLSVMQSRADTPPAGPDVKKTVTTTTYVCCETQTVTTTSTTTVPVGPIVTSGHGRDVGISSNTGEVSIGFSNGATDCSVTVSLSTNGFTANSGGGTPAVLSLAWYNGEGDLFGVNPVGPTNNYDDVGGYTNTISAASVYWAITFTTNPVSEVSVYWSWTAICPSSSSPAGGA